MPFRTQMRAMVEAVSARRFRQLLAADPAPPIIDTRPTEDFESWHIPGAINIPATPADGIDVDAVSDAVSDTVDTVLTVCGWGISSFAVGEALEAEGFHSVLVLKDGMVGWSQVYDIPAIELDDGITAFQLQRLAKGCLGYVMACTETGAAVAIDVPVHIDEVVSLLDSHGLTLETVIDTHLHADHVSGGYALADRFGVPYRISERAADRGLQYDHVPLADREIVQFGESTITTLATPGHTTELMSLVIGEETAVCTADTLFTDGVGRTELESPNEASARASELYRSITGRLFGLDEDALVLPGHFNPGIDTLRHPASPECAPVAEVRTAVDVLSSGEEEFVDRITDRGAPRPPNYRAIMLVNLGGRPLPGDGVLSQLELGPNRCAATT